jgi:heme A synthase
MKGLHRFTILVACATFVLIIAGVLVTSNDAGLATSDWPLSNGQVFPKMVGNLFWEHGHRMVATTVGLLTLTLALHLFLKEERAWVRRLGLVGLIAVIAQGLLGGLTVKLLLPLAVSAAHATLAQLFFCTTVSLTIFTSKGWMQEESRLEEKGIVPIRRLCAAAVVTIFLQLIHWSYVTSLGDLGQTIAGSVGDTACRRSIGGCLDLGKCRFNLAISLPGRKVSDTSSHRRFAIVGCATHARHRCVYDAPRLTQ